jgi:hypothetical protein
MKSRGINKSLQSKSWIASSQALLAMTARGFPQALPVIASEAIQEPGKSARASSKRTGRSRCPPALIARRRRAPHRSDVSIR